MIYGDQNPIAQKKVVPCKVKCRLRIFPACYQVSLHCPRHCPYNCLMDCTRCRPVCSSDQTSALCQDPRFVDGDGITFYFHGKKDRDFCLVTDHNLHINAHFIGKRKLTMTRDFTWVQSITILFHPHHTLLIVAQKTTIWDDSSDRLYLTFDNHSISLPPAEGATWHHSASPIIYITRTRATNGVIVEVVGMFTITAAVVPIAEDEARIHGYNITEDDCFTHLELGFKFYGPSEEVDGVLGQTYRANYTSRVKVGTMMPVLGGNKEFSTSNIFATDCIASRFNEDAVVAGSARLKELPSLQIGE